jgi:hypothetical protein
MGIACAKPAKPPEAPKQEFYPGDATRCPVPKPMDVKCDYATDPGRVTLRRLNRTEYNNSVRDLLGDTHKPADDFPPDNVANGFDTNGDLLSVSTLFMDQALLAAQQVVDDAWDRDAPPEKAAALEAIEGATKVYNGWELPSGKDVTATIQLEESAFVGVRFELTASMPAIPPIIHVKLDGETLPFEPLQWRAGSSTVVTVASLAPLARGAHTVTLETDGLQGTTVLIQSARWAARPSPRPFGESRLRTCDITVAACAKEIVSRLAHKAWRRPLSEEEVSSLVELASHGTTNEERLLEGAAEAGLKDALVAVFASPYFLFRVELDPDVTTCAPHPLEDHELATRLAYTLWSTTPDDQLLSLADQCRLQDPGVYAAEIDRLLSSPQSQSFVRNFGGQWLKTRQLEGAHPDPELFPEFDEALREAMQAETEALFSAFLYEDRPFHEILDTDFTFLNDRLAEHYGLAPPGSAALVRESLPSGMLGGLLTRAGLLTLTSQPNRTSPVKRGNWVLSNLLCAEPPPPPDSVPPLPSTGELGGKTMKERMAQHRTDPVCANCHAAMDPIGLALENYDPIGHWRTTDNGEVIDPSGALPDGRKFQTPAELAQLLKTDARLSLCATRRLFTYAVGRSPTGDDLPALRELDGLFNQDGQRLGALVRRVLTSRAFTTRRAQAPPSP